MRRGFTILELLVASLLLGMLMSILTMIFNQSSIAWRTGIAGVADLDDVRDKVSAVRYESDNAYVWDGQVKCVLGVFDKDGKMRETRLCGSFDEESKSSVKGIDRTVSGDEAQYSCVSDVGCADGQSSSSANYVVNVMSAGPDREMDTYDDIWSYPDDPNEYW